jgi:hypothetical protein
MSRILATLVRLRLWLNAGAGPRPDPYGWALQRHAETLASLRRG